jgi:hypothetical protein
MRPALARKLQAPCHVVRTLVPEPVAALLHCGRLFLDQMIKSCSPTDDSAVARHGEIGPEQDGAQEVAGGEALTFMARNLASARP